MIEHLQSSSVLMSASRGCRSVLSTDIFRDFGNLCRLFWGRRPYKRDTLCRTRPETKLFLEKLGTLDDLHDSAAAYSMNSMSTVIEFYNFQILCTVSQLCSGGNQSFNCSLA